jgi:hypothetical protein
MARARGAPAIIRNDVTAARSAKDGALIKAGVMPAKRSGEPVAALASGDHGFATARRARCAALQSSGSEAPLRHVMDPDARNCPPNGFSTAW